jgi:hypothetical protein
VKGSNSYRYSRQVAGLATVPHLPTSQKNRTHNQ